VSGYLQAAPARFSSLPAALAQIEKTNGGRLGAAVLDTATGERSGYRERERFPMCSTFKFLLASAVLQRVDRHDESLDRAIAIPQGPLLSHSPVSEAHAGATMTVAALCEAVLTDVAAYITQCPGPEAKRVAMLAEIGSLVAGR